MTKYLLFFCCITLFAFQGCAVINLFYAGSNNVTFHFHAGGGGDYDAVAYIDGKEMVNGNYHLNAYPIIETKYLNLTRGKHHLKAYSRTGTIEYETDFDVKGEWTYILLFWGYGKEAHFRLDSSENGVGFI